MSEPDLGLSRAEPRPVASGRVRRVPISVTRRDAGRPPPTGDDAFPISLEGLSVAGLARLPARAPEGATRPGKRPRGDVRGPRQAAGTGRRLPGGGSRGAAARGCVRPALKTRERRRHVRATRLFIGTATGAWRASRR